MVERSGYTVYFSTDLREKVSNWADNSTSCQADILDKALEDFFASHTITEDGTIVTEDANSRRNGSGGADQEELLHQIIANQEEMMEGLTASSSTPSERETENKNSEHPQDASTPTGDGDGEGYEHLRQHYDHDEVINPDDVDVRFVPNTRKVAVPVLAGVLNWRREEKGDECVPRTEILDYAENVLDVSRPTARSYVDELVTKGIIYPHPSMDDDVVGEDAIAEMRAFAASPSDKRGTTRIDVSEMKPLKQERYVADPDEYIGEMVDDWESETYYLDESAYVREMWNLINKGTAAIVAADTKVASRPNGDSTRMTEEERAYGASHIVARMMDKVEDVTGVEWCQEARIAIGKARKVGNDDDRKEWSEGIWRDVADWVEAELLD